MNAGSETGALKRGVVDWQSGEISVREVLVPAETPLELEAGGKLLAVLHSTPAHLDELAAGFLLGQGYITSFSDIEGISLRADGRRLTVKLSVPIHAPEIDPGRKIIYSGCGQAAIGPEAAEVKKSQAPENGAPSQERQAVVFDPEAVRAGLAAVLRSGHIYRHTRGIHSAGICARDGHVHVLREDIGRHNALDKVLGWAAARCLDPERILVAASGRIASEAIIKLSRFGIRLMVSRGVPTSLAIRLADEADITLAGSIGATSLRVYTHPARLGLGQP